MSDRHTAGFICAVIGICALIVLGYCFCPYLNPDRRRSVEEEWYTDDHWKPRCRRGRRRPVDNQGVFAEPPPPEAEAPVEEQEGTWEEGTWGEETVVEEEGEEEGVAQSGQE